ncbi:MAG: hypothetical protein JWQ21_764 [Herminiimonas sp.]|nr:hypothetical protein [Herminiimonas sp.]
MTATITFNLSIMYFVAANVIAILAYVLTVKYRVRRNQRNLDVLTNAIVQYFRLTGVEVSVNCTSLANDKHFIAFIDSEPMKRFRLSSMIEMSLMDHISTTCDLKLDTVYWRFKIRKGVRDDEYIRDGLASYELEESTLEDFNTASKS